MADTIISIIIVARNNERGISETLTSLNKYSKQLDAARAEILVIDGESTDSTFAVADHFRKNSNLKIFIKKQKPRGIYPAMNLGISLAKGEWLLFLNSGDKICNAKSLVDEIMDPKNIFFIAIQGRYAIQHPGRKWHIELKGPIRCHQSLVYKASNHDLLGNYDEVFRVCSDTLFINRLDPQRIKYSSSLWAISTVSPSDTSRDPDSVKHDLTLLANRSLATQPWPKPKLTLLILKFEKILGFSLTVWVKSFIGILNQSSRFRKLG